MNALIQLAAHRLRPSSKRFWSLLACLTSIAMLTGPSNAWATSLVQDGDKTVIVIRDYRLLRPDEFSARQKEADSTLSDAEIQQRYAEHVATVRKVQREQYSVVRRALQQYGIKQLFIEAVPAESLNNHLEEIKNWAAQASKADELRQRVVALRQALEARQQAGETGGDFQEKLQELRDAQAEIVAFGMDELRYGVAARLIATDDLSDIALGALDTKETLKLFDPDGSQTSDGPQPTAEEKAKREQLLAQTVAEWLKEHDTAVLVLSGDADLRDELQKLGQEVQYGSATVPSFPRDKQ